jgi:hypothetical protein
MARVKQGRIIEVDNKERVFGSALSYKAIWVEDSDGKNERCLLFTDKEIEDAHDRAKKNIEDLTDRSFLTELLD